MGENKLIKAMHDSAVGIAAAKAGTRKRNQWAYARATTIREWAATKQVTGTDEELTRQFFGTDPTAKVERGMSVASVDPSTLADLTEEQLAEAIRVTETECFAVWVAKGEPTIAPTF